MFMSTREKSYETSGDGFSRPVESIMRCEDFKSNFARRLSNRFISRSPIRGKNREDILKIQLGLHSPEAAEKVTQNSDQCLRLSNKVTMVEHLAEEVSKPPDKVPSSNTVISSTEVTALNMEVETLRWQLAQTEANRQMHIALLKQIVAFLNKIREHMECQKQELPKREDLTHRVLPRSFNSADLPRCHSVLHVNKNVEYTLTPTKKLNSRKISKSISNVNGFKECNRWSQSKLSLASDTQRDQKLSEEISRLTALANTVLNIKLPELACACTENTVTVLDTEHENKTIAEVGPKQHGTQAKEKLDLIEEDNICRLNTVDSDPYGRLTKYVEMKDRPFESFILAPSPIPYNSEKDFISIKTVNSVKSNTTDFDSKNGTSKRMKEKRCDNSKSCTFVEDESGFSSMSSFQEIGIPIINVIPPTPCKEVGFLEALNDVDQTEEIWKHKDTLGLEKQSMKVFWV